MTGNLSFNGSIPQPGDVPTISQGQILTNFTSDLAIWNVDHQPFNANNSGTHFQNTYIGFTSANAVTSPPGFPANGTTASSIAFTAPGIDQSSTAQYFFEQNNTPNFSTYPLSAIKCFCVFTPSTLSTSPNVLTILNQFNVVSISQVSTSMLGTAGTTTWTITLKAGTASSNNAAVFVVQSSQGTKTQNFIWSFTGAPSAPVLTISTIYPIAGMALTNINIAILQI